MLCVININWVLFWKMRLIITIIILSKKKISYNTIHCIAIRAKYRRWLQYYWYSAILPLSLCSSSGKWWNILLPSGLSAGFRSPLGHSAGVDGCNPCWPSPIGQCAVFLPSGRLPSPWRYINSVKYTRQSRWNIQCIMNQYSYLLAKSAAPCHLMPPWIFQW